ncbi:hypothetical protein C4553_02530 [Candidatus Parcubacteria bacterium]|nr:MAG: hypothetical protein C4553_02530 [Candidatus Parcubacteria bacterium]
MNRFLIIIFLAVLFIPAVALAQAQPPSQVSVTIPNPLCPSGQPNCQLGIPDVVNNIIDFLLFIGLPLATLVVLWAGFLYLTAGGNPEKIKTANKALLWAIVGIIILMISKGIVLLIQSIIS